MLPAHRQPRKRSTMPLTRHLYELDEVVSALQTCLRNGWPRAPFWTWELLVSHEWVLARKTLRDTWLHHGGGYDPALVSLQPTDDATDTTWLDLTLRVGHAVRAARGLTAAEMLRRTSSLSVRPDVTPLPRGAAAAQRRASRSAAFTAALDPAEDLPATEAAEWWISLDAACRQGSRTNAVWLLQAAQPFLSADGIWAALRTAARGGLGPTIASLERAATADLHPTQQLLAQTNAVLLLCAHGQEERDSFLSTAVAKQGRGFWLTEWTRWNTLVGRRAARIYGIPAEALHAETTRGAMSRRFTNIGDVREPKALLLEGCAYWRAAATAAGITEDDETGAILFPSDDVLESFSDEQFPDDIPDEWSGGDQEKSHGRGCAEAAPPAPPPLCLREEPVSQRVWHMAIGCRSPAKKLTARWRGGGGVSSK